MHKRHAWRPRRHELSPVVQRDNADTDEPPRPAKPCKAAATARRRLTAAPGRKGVVRTRVVYAQFGCPARPRGWRFSVVGAEESMGAPQGSLSLASISIVDYFRNMITPVLTVRDAVGQLSLRAGVWSAGDLSQHLSRRSNRGGDGRRGPPASERPMKVPGAANHSSRALKGTMSGSACWSPTSTRGVCGLALPRWRALCFPPAGGSVTRVSLDRCQRAGRG